jgi:hypothetical protein
LKKEKTSTERVNNYLESQTTLGFVVLLMYILVTCFAEVENMASPTNETT